MPGRTVVEQREITAPPAGRSPHELAVPGDEWCGTACPPGRCVEACGGWCGEPGATREGECECECWKCGERYPCSFELLDRLPLDRPFAAAEVFIKREGEESNLVSTPRREEDCRYIPALRCQRSCGSCTQGEDNEETIVALYYEDEWVPLPRFMECPKSRNGIHEVERGFNRDRITLQILNRMLFQTSKDHEVAREDARGGASTAPDLGGATSTFNTVPSGMGAAIYWVDGTAAGFYTYAMADNSTFIDRFWPVPALACCAVRPSFRRRGLGAQMVAHFYRTRHPADLGCPDLPTEEKAGIHTPVSNPMLHTLRKTLSETELSNIMMLEVLPEGRRLNHSGCTVSDLEACGRSVARHISSASKGSLGRRKSDLVDRSRRALQSYRHPKPIGADDSVCSIM